MYSDKSYRPHNPGHDYYAPGIYLITLVVRHRKENAQMLGRLNNDLKQSGVVLNEVGKAVIECWEAVPTFEESKGRNVVVHTAVCMPDHFHGVIEVVEKIDVSLGQVIWGFKVACTKRWRALLHPRTAAEKTEKARETTAGSGQPSLVVQGHTPDLHRMSKKQRAEYYATHPEALQPLWDDDYDDTICLSDPQTGAYDMRHFSAMVRYVDDNPRRAIIRRLRPQYMQRCLHVRIDGRDYAAFGNMFLLRWARKVQVFCHRKAPDGHTPYETTEEYRNECRYWEKMVLEGATVIVTPGISRGEAQMKDMCLEKGYPLIHLQKDPIGPYWKPEERRFNSCANGMLLILSPWKHEEMGDVNGVPSSTAYSMFHNLNTLAQDICNFNGTAVVVGR